MALIFPSSPTIGQTYTAGGRTWRWNGTAWQTVGGGSGGVTSYNDLTDRPTLGSAAATAASDYATAAQGAKADTALQPNPELREAIVPAEAFQGLWFTGAKTLLPDASATTYSASYGSLTSTGWESTITKNENGSWTWTYREKPGLTIPITTRTETSSIAAFPYTSTWPSAGITAGALISGPALSIANGGTGATTVEQAMINLGALQSRTGSYIIAKPGDDLLAKYDEAKALNPSGAENRTSLIIFPGSYAIIATLSIDAQFVDVIGLGAQTKKPAVFIAGNTLSVSANDVRVSGISVGEQSFEIVGNKPLQVFENCTGGDESFGGGGEGTASGTFINCKGGYSSFGGGYYSTASGTFINCEGSIYSFGGGDYSNATGVFTGCVGGFLSFGGGIVSNASGTFTDCTGEDGSFGGGSIGLLGWGSSAIGTFTNCTGGHYSFGSGSAYGGGRTMGTFTNCKAGNYSFGGWGEEALCYGTFTNCSAGIRSFGSGEWETDATFINCTGGAESFGSRSNGGPFNGLLRDCRLTSGTFIVGRPPKMINCIDGNGDIIEGDAIE